MPQTNLDSLHENDYGSARSGRIETAHLAAITGRMADHWERRPYLIDPYGQRYISDVARHLEKPYRSTAHLFSLATAKFYCSDITPQTLQTFEAVIERFPSHFGRGRYDSQKLLPEILEAATRLSPHERGFSRETVKKFVQQLKKIKSVACRDALPTNAVPTCIETDFFAASPVTKRFASWGGCRLSDVEGLAVDGWHDPYAEFFIVGFLTDHIVAGFPINAHANWSLLQDGLDLAGIDGSLSLNQARQKLARAVILGIGMIHDSSIEIWTILRNGNDIIAAQQYRNVVEPTSAS